MIIISHRANLIGNYQDSQPDLVEKVISMGFDCEIDCRLINNKIYLGHDFPLFDVSKSWLNKHKKSLWLHCKNFEFMNWCIGKDCNYFWHDTDERILTSKGFVWTYPGKELIKNSIAVMDDRIGLAGICTDYPIKWRKQLNSL